MIKTGSLANYTNSIFDMTISADSPHSGFEVSLMETGAFYSPNLITLKPVVLVLAFPVPAHS